MTSSLLWFIQVGIIAIICGFTGFWMGIKAKEYEPTEDFWLRFDSKVMWRWIR